jgi:hypothetical protein
VAFSKEAIIVDGHAALDLGLGSRLLKAVSTAVSEDDEANATLGLQCVLRFKDDVSQVVKSVFANWTAAEQAKLRVQFSAKSWGAALPALAKVEHLFGHGVKVEAEEIFENVIPAPVNINKTKKKRGRRGRFQILKYMLFNLHHLSLSLSSTFSN